MQIIKRNGTKESFNIRKIASAVKRALDETQTEYSPPYPIEFAKAIEAYFIAQGKKELSIDEVQDQTELFLISDFPQAGKAYLLYRKDRENLWKYGWDMNDLQRDIYESKYRYKKESFREFVERVAINNRPIQKAILEKKFIPAGRILAGRGLHEEGRKLSYFNCFYPGTKVLTKSGYKPIEQIQKGEYVLTGDGTYQKVNETMVSDFSGELIVFDKSYTNNTIKTTPNHKFLTQKGWKTAEEIYIHNNKGKKKQYYGFLAKPSYALIERTYDIKSLLEEKNRQYIIEENFINTITPFEATRGKTVYNSHSKGSKMFAQVKMNEDILYLLGRYLGDGSLTIHRATTHNNPCIFQLVFNAKTEKKDYIRCKKIIEENFGVTITDNSNKNQNTLVLKVNNEPFCLLIDSLVGRGENKHFPVDYKNNLSVLLGLLDADGYLVKSGNSTAVRLVLKNTSLFKEALSSLQNNGFNVWNAKKIQHGKDKKYSGWCLQVSARLSYRLIKLMTKEYEDNRHVVKEEEEKYCLLGKPTKEKYVGPVYNLSVENNHEYYVEGILAHNCYVVEPPEDNIESIWDAAKNMARTFSAGGGCGTDLSKLRPKNALVNNAAQTTSGAVSFMDLYSLTTGLIGQSGRRGALMLTLSSRHPDIEEFIKVKNDLEKVTFANISVRVDSELIELAKKPFGSIVDLLYRPNQQSPEYEGVLYTLRFKVDATGEVIEKKVGAKYLISLIAANIWNMAEPGLAFWDRIENWHLKSEYDDFEFASTNPCGEQPLSSNSACCLSSVNLSEFVLNPFTDDAKFDFNNFKKVVRNGVVFLNEILDEGMKHHPLQAQRDSTKKYREIGLGFLGLADMFIKMGVKYGSLQSIEIIDEIMYIMINEAAQESALLAQIYGSAPAFREKEILNSEFAKENFSKETKELISKYGLRNTQILTVAPTGSISTMLGASGGIEPLFQISFNRRTLSINEGEETVYKVFSPVVKELMETKGIVEEKDLPDYVITAHDLNGKDRINIQGAIQKRVDAAISSTINLKEEATIQDIYDLIIYGHEQGLKGITFYRDGCARTGILTTDKKEKKVEVKEEVIIRSTGKTADICAECGGTIIHNNGCFECQDCGASACSL